MLWQIKESLSTAVNGIPIIRLYGINVWEKFSFLCHINSTFLCGLQVYNIVTIIHHDQLVAVTYPHS